MKNKHTVITLAALAAMLLCACTSTAQVPPANALELKQRTPAGDEWAYPPPTIVPQPNSALTFGADRKPSTTLLSTFASAGDLSLLNTNLSTLQTQLNTNTGAISTLQTQINNIHAGFPIAKGYTSINSDGASINLESSGDIVLVTNNAIINPCSDFEVNSSGNVFLRSAGNMLLRSADADILLQSSNNSQILVGESLDIHSNNGINISGGGGSDGIWMAPDTGYDFSRTGSAINPQGIPTLSQVQSLIASTTSSLVPMQTWQSGSAYFQGALQNVYATLAQDYTPLTTWQSGSAFLQSQAHSHANKPTLDKITEAAGQPLWSGSAWPAAPASLPIAGNAVTIANPGPGNLAITATSIRDANDDDTPTSITIQSLGNDDNGTLALKATKSITLTAGDASITLTDDDNITLNTAGDVWIKGKNFMDELENLRSDINDARDTANDAMDRAQAAEDVPGIEDRLNSRLDAIEQRLDAIEQRLDTIEGKLDN